MKFPSQNRKALVLAIAILVIAVLAIIGIVQRLAPVATNGGSPQAIGNGKPTIAFYAFNSEPVLDWDPSVEFSNGIVVMNNVYETLLKYNPLEDKMEPVLATEYSKGDGGLTWTFKIRKGVKFHDGTDLNAEAVKFSIERTKRLGKGAAYIWDSVQKINVIDEYTVEFKLKYPAPLDLIASSGYAAFIMSPTAVKANPDDWLSKGNEAGTGPYMLQSTKMGEEVVLTAFDRYWRGWNGKHFNKVIIKKIPETASRRQLVEKGEADVTIELPYEDIEALKNNAAVNIMASPSFQNLFFFFNTQKAPLNKKLVRQALSYAFPYDDAIKYAVGGKAKQAKGAIPYGHWGHGEDLFQYKYDLKKAKELLRQAGFPNGSLKFLLTYLSGDEAEKKASELYKAELAKINVDLEIRAMPWESQWELSKSKDPNKRQDIMVMYWWPDYASPYSWLLNLFHTEKEIMFNVGYWYNANFDKMIDAANEKSGVDRAQAEKLYVEAQKILIEEAPTIFAYDKEYVWVLNKAFKGHKNNPIYPNVVFFYNTYRE